MDSIAYVNTVGTRHTFYCLADGDRPVLAVYVDDVPGAGDELPILIGHVNGDPSTIQETKGTARADVVPVTDAVGDVIGLDRRVCLKSIAAYVVPRTATMMARVYVPTN